jgi:hypothetical protein
MSYRAMTQRHSRWDDVDNVLTMYLDADSLAVRGDGTINPKEQEYFNNRGITVPISYAINQIRMTQLFGIWAGRVPTIGIRGVGEEDMASAAIMEAAISADCDRGNALLSLFGMTADAEKYGGGWLYDWWEEQYGWVRGKPSTLALYLNTVYKAIGRRAGKPMGPLKWDFVSEFNASRCPDPRLMYPDPRKPLSDLQRGEFIGHADYKSYLELLSRSMENNGPYFNIETVKKIGPSSGMDTGRRGYTRHKITDIKDYELRGSLDDNDRGFHICEQVQIRLVPREWKLGPETRPQVWWFELCDEQVLIRAHRSAYDHGEFSYSYAEANPDPHSITNPGSVEVMLGLQTAMDWLFNSHFEQIRRALNNVLLYLPSLIEEDDLLNPGPMQHIRLSRIGENMALSGQITLDTALRQLQVQDITGPHLAFFGQVMELAQRMGAAADSQMSMPTGPGKRTAYEVQSILQSSSQRVAIEAKLMDIAAVKPWARRMIKNRLQFTSIDQWVPVVGDTIEKSPDAKRLLITPENIAGNYDNEPLEGTTPQDPTALAETWAQFMQSASTLAQYPGFGVPDMNGEVFQIKAAFKEFAKRLGVRNVDRFFASVMPQLGAPGMNVVPDEVVAAEAQKGNLVPV